MATKHCVWGIIFENWYESHLCRTRKSGYATCKALEQYADHKIKRLRESVVRIKRIITFNFQNSKRTYLGVGGEKEHAFMLVQ